MMKLLHHSFGRSALISTAAIAIGLNAGVTRAQMYSPVSISSNREVTDTLTNEDIPTGFGGYARDYQVDLLEGDQVAVDLISEEFDTLVSLIAPDGSTVGENDDGPDGTTNSLLFARITQAGPYTVRVRSYAGEGAGQFRLKVTRLRPVE